MSYMWGLCWPVEASHALCNFSTLSWHVWDLQTDACSHSICMALTTQCLWNTKKAWKRLTPGMTSVLVETISRCFHPKHWRLYSICILSVGVFPGNLGSTSHTLYKLSYKLGRLRWSNAFFKTFVQRAKSTKHTDAQHIVYSPTSVKQFEHCFIFLFTNPLHLSQSPHKNHMHLCQRVTRSVFLPAQVSSVISISVVMATQQQGGKWQPNLWHSCRPGQAWGQGGIAAMGCKTLLGLPALNQIILTSEKNENFLIPSTAVLVGLMSLIFALTPLFKNGSIKYWTWRGTLNMLPETTLMIYNWHNTPSKRQSHDKEVVSCLIWGQRKALRSRSNVTVREQLVLC